MYKDNFTTKREGIVFGSTSFPFSSDPMDFDYYIHHYAFSSVYARLVSAGKRGEYFPMISSNWSHSADFKIWKFKIRKDLQYSTGENITPEDVLLSLKRVAFLKQKKKSESGLIEFLVDIEKEKNITANWSGAYLENDWLVLNFSRPMDNLLEIISFGFYGISHPDLFSHETGEWKNKTRVISSGPYEVVQWDENNFQLKYRKANRFVDDEKRIDLVTFRNFLNDQTAEDVEKNDLLVADKENLIVSKKFDFIGPTTNLKIAYALCSSWNRAGSPCRDIALRRWFRHKFYDGIRSMNYPLTFSFFPQTLKNVHFLDVSDEAEKPVYGKVDLITHPILISGKINENKEKTSIADVYSMALKNMGNDKNVNFIQKLGTDEELDVNTKSTGIEFENYIDTVRFMFLSKDGIRLPDTTGNILIELKKENPDINFINREIWDQAVVWPIRHYTSGFWFNRKSNINYEEINVDSPSIDFQFLRWN